MKKLLLTSILLMTEMAFAGTWVLATKPEFADPKDKIKKSVLRFTQRSTGVVQTYIPQETPFGLYDSKEVSLNGKSYFITFWADGVHTVYYRVFNPDESAMPVCEFLTESENPQVRFKNNQIQYLETAFLDGKKKMSVWKKCLPVKSSVADKAPASVPKKKPLKKKR